MSNGSAKLVFVVALVINCILFSQSRYGQVSRQPGSSLFLRTWEQPQGGGLHVLVPENQVLSTYQVSLRLAFYICFSVGQKYCLWTNSVHMFTTLVLKTIHSCQYHICNPTSAPTHQYGPWLLQVSLCGLYFCFPLSGSVHRISSVQISQQSLKRWDWMRMWQE